MAGDYNKPGDHPIPGIPFEATGKARERIERASRLLEQRGVQPRTPEAERIMRLANASFAGESLSQGREERLPPAHGEVHDVTVTDRLGQPLTLRTEDGTREQLRGALQSDQGHVSHQVRIRTYQEGHEVGRANLTLEADKTFNDVTGHYDRVSDCQMRLNDIEVADRDHRRGIGSLMLERAEELARQSGARELYGTLESEQAHPFFEKHGYRSRPGRYGGQELYKTFYLS